MTSYSHNASISVKKWLWVGLAHKYAVVLVVEGMFMSSKTRLVLRYYSLFETVTITSLKNDKTAINILAL